MTLIQVLWQFPEVWWIKVNMDGATCGSPSLIACGGIFRGSLGEYIYGFSTFLGIHTSVYVEIIGVIIAAIEHSCIISFHLLHLTFLGK